MFNNNLLEFLDLAYDDGEFLNKINYYILVCLENLLDKVEEISIIFIENDFTYKSIYEYIKLKFDNANLNKDMNSISKIKKYNLDLSNKVLEKTIDIMYTYKPVDIKDNNNDDKKILLFSRRDNN